MQTQADGHADATTTALLQAARGGDNSAWDELLCRYGGLVRAAVARHHLTVADAADAVQNTWLRLIERAITVRDPEKLGGWLATTARRESLALIRRGRVEIPTDLMNHDRAVPDPTPEAAVIAADTRWHVRRAAGELTGRPRVLIEALYYRPCHSYSHLSRETGIPMGSIGPGPRQDHS